MSRWGPVVAWASVIWVFSTDSFRGEETSEILGPVLAILLPWADAEQLRIAHALARKLAHVTEYGILAALVVRALHSSEASLARTVLGAIALSATYAATDELHQSFVASRTGAVSDVLLDTLGASLGAAVAGWWLARSVRIDDRHLDRA